MNAPWTVKHRPKMLADIAGNKPTIQQILDWLELWKKGPPKKRALLLHGPPGTGKTVSVEAAANERGLDLVEINASDKRNRDALEKTVGLATRQSDLFGRSRLVLIDEVDGINLSEDRGAVDTIVRLVEDTQVPCDTHCKRSLGSKDRPDQKRNHHDRIQETWPQRRRALSEEDLSERRRRSGRTGAQIDRRQEPRRHALDHERPPSPHLGTEETHL